MQNTLLKWQQVGNEARKSAEEILLSLQAAQQTHDLLAHRDILNLDTQTRLKHMILHFLKYSGKMAIAQENRDEKLLINTLIDTFIICLATANALNVSLGADLNILTSDLKSLGIELSKNFRKEKIHEHALIELVTTAGRMAKSIESTDHLERGNPRAELEKLIVELSSAMLGISGLINFTLQDEIEKRWKIIETKSIFSRTVKS